MASTTPLYAVPVSAKPLAGYCDHRQWSYSDRDPRLYPVETAAVFRSVADVFFLRARALCLRRSAEIASPPLAIRSPMEGASGHVGGVVRTLIAFHTNVGRRINRLSLSKFCALRCVHAET